MMFVIIAQNFHIYFLHPMIKNFITDNRKTPAHHKHRSFLLSDSFYKYFSTSISPIARFPATISEFPVISTGFPL